MLNALGLGFLFKAKDETGHVIKKVNDGLDGLKDAAKESGNSITAALGMSTKAIVGTAAAIAAVTAGGAFALASAAGKFETGVKSAGAIAGATTKEFQMLRDAAIEAGLAAQFSPNEATRALQDLAAAGYNVKESIGLLTPVLNLAGGSLGQLGPSEAAGLAAQTMKAFGLSIDQAGISVDRLLQSVNMFALEAKDLPLSLGIASRGAQVMNQSLSETLIAVGLVKNIIPSIERSATGVAVAMERLVDPEWAEKVSKLGVAVTTSDGKFRSFLDILNELQPQLAKMSEKDSSAFLLKTFGHHALGSISAILTQLRNGIKTSTGEMLTGAEALKYLRDQFENAGGTAKKFKELMLDTFEGQKKMLGAALETSAILLGDAFKNQFTGILKGANLFIRGLIQLFTQGGFTGEIREALDKNLGIKEFAIGVFMWISRIKNFFSNLGQSFAETFAPFAPLIDVLFSAFSQLGQALGITGQSAGQNAGMFDTFGEAGATVGSVLAGLAWTVLPFVIGVIQTLTIGVNILRAAWEAVMPVMRSVGGVLSGVFEMIGGLLTGNWTALWDGFVDVVTNAGMAIVRIITGALGIVAKLIDGVGSAVGKDLGLNERLQNIMGETATANVKNGFTGANMKAWVGDQSRPAVAAEMQRNYVMANSISAIAARGGDAGAQDVHSHVTLMLDGEKLAEAHATSKRSAAARSYREVPATAGGY